MNIRIPGSVLVYWNPVANKDRAMRFKSELIGELQNAGLKMERSIDGSIVLRPPNQEPSQRLVEGSFVIRPTLEKPEERKKDIISQIGILLKKNPRQRVTSVGIGGDFTAHDVGNAVGEARMIYAHNGVKPHVVAVAGPGGTANDICSITGVPRNVERFIRFLDINSSVVTELPWLKFEFMLPQNKRMKATSPFGLIVGSAGHLFRHLEEVRSERRKKGESVAVRDYLFLLPKTIVNAKTIRARIKINEQWINGGEVIRCGQIIGPLSTHQLGSVTKVPMLERGAVMFLPYPLPHGVIPFSEPFIRNILVMMGFQHFVSWGRRVFTLSKERQINLQIGDTVEMYFNGGNGLPAEQLGVLAGDSVGPFTGVKASVVGTLPFLADPRSDLRVQQGLEEPLLPGDRLTDGAVSNAFALVRSGVDVVLGAFRK